MRAACLLLLLPLASGCNHLQASGGSFHLQTGPAFAAVLGAAVLATNIDARIDFSSGLTPMSNAAAPEMLADRAVAERDCTRPIEDWSANLKCR